MHIIKRLWFHTESAKAHYYDGMIWHRKCLREVDKRVWFDMEISYGTLLSP